MKKGPGLAAVVVEGEVQVDVEEVPCVMEAVVELNLEEVVRTTFAVKTTDAAVELKIAEESADRIAAAQMPKEMDGAQVEGEVAQEAKYQELSDVVPLGQIHLEAGQTEALQLQCQE